MLYCAVKFCGGCNPRYNRVAVYHKICKSLEDNAVFVSPNESEHYDLLLIIRGCTCCPYLYEDISADYRIVLTDQSSIKDVLSEIHTVGHNAATELNTK